ncbi:hypothetical protein BDW68DRAFT_164050 [Aspergillus falconensis]
MYICHCAYPTPSKSSLLSLSLAGFADCIATEGRLGSLSLSTCLYTDSVYFHLTNGSNYNGGESFARRCFSS